MQNTSEAGEKLPPVDIGDTLPTLTLKNEKNEDIQIADLASEKGVVLFLVPKADTPGCTTQACGFRDIYPDFTSVNFDVYCLSADSPAAQTAWQIKVASVVGTSDIGSQTPIDISARIWRRRKDAEKSFCLWKGRQPTGQEESGPGG